MPGVADRIWGDSCLMIAPYTADANVVSAVDAAIRSRRSVRRFLPVPIAT